MTTDGRKMNARIPCTSEVRDLVRDYANGMGITYDEAIAYVFGKHLNLLPDEGTKAFATGREQKESAVEWLNQHGRKWA